MYIVDNMDLQQNLREIILNLREPYIMRNMKLPWKCFKISLFEWCQLFDKGIEAETNNKMVIEFETGSKKFSDIPLWERFRNIIPLTFKEFYEKSLDNSKDDFLKDNWISYNYKNIEKMTKICKNGVSFSDFGFKDCDDDITFWLGSENVHTPCHFDTYGCNIVVQVYGRKMWLLFPPNTDLTPIRIPYEESSVYCTEVFYSPKDPFNYKNISKDCYKCILEPGDVLIVPNKWWHYVENLSQSFSINCWIPLENDIDSQMEECIVKFIIETIINSSPTESKNLFLNPNEDLMGEEMILRIIEHLTKEKLNESTTVTTNKKLKSNKYPYQYLSIDEIENLMKSLENEIKLEKVNQINENEFFDTLNKNSIRYDPDKCIEDSLSIINLIKSHMVNTLCDPKIITKIKENFLKRFAQKQ